MRRHQGFFTAELAIAVALALIFVVAGAAATIYKSRQATGTKWQGQHATDMALIAKAVKTYTSTTSNVSGWTANARNTITIATLQGAGLLPADFAARAAVGTSPFGQPYAIAAIKGTDNRVRSVIYETGTALPSRLESSGIEQTAERILGLKSEVAQAVQRDYKLAAGTLAASSLNVNGSLKSFTKDVTSWVQTAPTQALSVVLVGFPDLDALLCEGPACTGATQYQSCRVITPFCNASGGNEFHAALCWGRSGGMWQQYQAQNPNCAGNEVAVRRFSHCTGSGTVSAAEVGGSLTFGQSLEEDTPGRTDAECASYAAAACPSCLPEDAEDLKDDCINQSRDVRTYRHITMNNTPQASFICSYSDQYAQGSVLGTNTFNYTPQAMPSTSAPESQPMDVLCCRP